jgi:hypothetical protein
MVRNSIIHFVYEILRPYAAKEVKLAGEFKKW